jgi:hypothetical protein
MRRLFLAALGLAVFAPASAALAHDPPPQNPCGITNPHAKYGEPTVTNPVTGGHYWVTPSGGGIQGGTGYVGVDGANGVEATNPAGDSQARVGPAGVCIAAAGQVVKVP